jgi:hypothetical protein
VGLQVCDSACIEFATAFVFLTAAAILLPLTARFYSQFLQRRSAQPLLCRVLPGQGRRKDRLHCSRLLVVSGCRFDVSVHTQLHCCNTAASPAKASILFRSALQLANLVYDSGFVRSWSWSSSLAPAASSARATSCLARAVHDCPGLKSLLLSTGLRLPERVERLAASRHC